MMIKVTPLESCFVFALAFASLPVMGNETGSVTNTLSGVERYQQVAGKPAAAVTTNCFDVDTTPTPALIFKTAAVGQHVAIYPMVHNNIAEGWSWQPEGPQRGEDYYRFKYLPIGSQLENRGEYQAEDKIGTPEAMKVRWQYDYFLAFENLYTFYPRNPEDDDSGFSFALKQAAPLDQEASAYVFRAHFCLASPSTTESTTFWKATHGKPVDFTLKKRYLLGKLISLSLLDTKTKQILGTLKPLDSAAPANQR